MSGRNQHFIPQSLLRGFGVKRGKKTYVVAYTFDRGIFAPPTDGIGAEGNFYSELDVEGTIETLDDKITDYEQRLPSVFEQLREPSVHANATLPAELVTHLTFRNDHFRKATSMGGAKLFEDTGALLNDEHTARALMGIAGNQPDEAFAAELEKMWEELRPIASLLGMTKEQFNEWMFQGIKANFSSFHREIAGPLKQTMGNIVEKAPEAAATAQRRSLSENMSPPKRVERLSGFQWKTVETAEALILPDCVAVAMDSENGLLPLMLADLEKTETIYMPLASNRLLIGSLEDGTEPPGNLKEVLASCSWDFFVARDRTPELEALRDLLRATSDNFMSRTVGEVIEEFARGGL